MLAFLGFAGVLGAAWYWNEKKRKTLAPGDHVSVSTEMLDMKTLANATPEFRSFLAMIENGKADVDGPAPETNAFLSLQSLDSGMKFGGGKIRVKVLDPHATATTYSVLYDPSVLMPVQSMPLTLYVKRAFPLSVMRGDTLVTVTQ